MEGIGLDAARRTCGDDRNELRPIQRSDRRRDRMPRVFAHQNCSSPEARVEGSHIATGFDKPFLVEDTVGGKKDLAMDVPNSRVRAAERDPQCGIVKVIAPQFVEAEADLERRCARADAEGRSPGSSIHDRRMTCKESLPIWRP